MLGCSTVHYLLERSRVIAQAPGERNYHVLYQMCKGMTDAERRALHLRPAHTFTFLNSALQAGTLPGSGASGVGAGAGGAASGGAGVWNLDDDAGDDAGPSGIDGVDDAAEWEATKAALRVMCATDGDRNGDQNGDVWRVLSSVLHLGDISFDVSPYGHATVCASAGVDTARQPPGGDAVGVDDVDVALAPSACAAEMLGVDVAALESALTSKMFASGRGSTATIPMSTSQVCTVCSVAIAGRGCHNHLTLLVYRRRAPLCLPLPRRCMGDCSIGWWCDSTKALHLRRSVPR